MLAKEITLQDINTIVEEATDSVMRSCNVQFAAIDKRFEVVDQRFDKLESRFDSLENRFDKLENKFDRLESRFDGLDDKMNTLIIYMKGHEKRIRKIEKTLAFA